MFKIAITGKANSGKNTVGKLLIKSLFGEIAPKNIHYMSFADPIKKMAQLAFPQVPRKWLYGSSSLRAKAIPSAFKDGAPLTVRQLLIDLGNDFGRKYQSDLWVRNFDHRFNKLVANYAKAVVVTDCRFRNEFDHLKNRGFYQIRLLRDASLKIDDVSETNQDGIYNDEFDAVISNNGTLKDLKAEVEKIVTILRS